MSDEVNDDDPNELVFSSRPFPGDGKRMILSFRFLPSFAFRSRVLNESNKAELLVWINFAINKNRNYLRSGV